LPWLAAVLAALVIGTSGAYAARWVCDDAFISFRYAGNLVSGRGLVYNVGEYVEGYTNFFWTLFVALGLKLGASAEAWSMAGGIICYTGSIGLLAANHQRLKSRLGIEGLAWPLAALLGALMIDWQVFATSGLETSAFTFLALAGFTLLTWEEGNPRPVWSGLLFSLALLTRLDGLLFAVCAGASFLVLPVRSRWRSLLAFTLALLLFSLPVLAWKAHYYQSWLPNTFYAKSADESWYAQGWIYFSLFFRKYWLLALSIPAGLILLIRFAIARRTAGLFERRSLRAALLPLGFACLYAFYVVRVGGDFMYARFLIPTAPFWLLAMDAMFLAVCRSPRPRLRHALPVLAGLFLVLTPPPFPGYDGPLGVKNEWKLYTPELTKMVRLKGQILELHFRDLPVRLAIYGMEASLAYWSKADVAIECVAGLTDPVIARQFLKERGPVGHEKKPTVDYLIEQRQVHFAYSPYLMRELGLDRFIPPSTIHFGPVPLFVLRWDAPLMKILRERGAQFEDFPAVLDRYIASMPTLAREQIAEDYQKFKRFYFNFNPDPVREAPFLERR